jgi:hypothetical protein
VSRALGYFCVEEEGCLVSALGRSSYSSAWIGLFPYRLIRIKKKKKELHLQSYNPFIFHHFSIMISNFKKCQFKVIYVLISTILIKFIESYSLTKVTLKENGLDHICYNLFFFFIRTKLELINRLLL